MRLRTLNLNFLKSVKHANPLHTSLICLHLRSSSSSAFVLVEHGILCWETIVCHKEGRGNILCFWDLEFPPTNRGNNGDILISVNLLSFFLNLYCNFYSCSDEKDALSLIGLMKRWHYVQRRLFLSLMKRIGDNKYFSTQHINNHCNKYLKVVLFFFLPMILSVCIYLICLYTWDWEKWFTNMYQILYGNKQILAVKLYESEISLWFETFSSLKTWILHHW